MTGAGYAVGDKVLSSLARLLNGSVRSCDVVARWGGEEFVIALPSTPIAGAILVADRIREALEEHEIIESNGQRVPVTASFGVAALVPQETLEQLVDRSDRAMYAAKSAGRNRVRSSSGASLSPEDANPSPREKTECRAGSRGERTAAGD